ncbi:MAG: hypothetical protein MUF75_01730 [Bacteroidia bacterium]|jgi:hypothetical protein|nr:hypothetical protein [Bacteroidia bacterium]
MKKIIFLVLLTHCLFAQEGKIKQQRYLGIGFNLNSLQATEFVLNVDPIKHLRAEIRYGQQNASREVIYMDVNGQQQFSDLSESSRTLRFGIFGLLSLEDLSLFGGFRYSWGKTNNENLSFEPFLPSQYIYESTNLINQFETVIGSEYRFFNRLALGAELAFVIGKTDYSSTQLNSSRGTNKENFFRTTAFIRFFPF